MRLVAEIVKTLLIPQLWIPWPHSGNHSYQSQTLRGRPQARHILVPDARRSHHTWQLCNHCHARFCMIGVSVPCNPHRMNNCPLCCEAIDPLLLRACASHGFLTKQLMILNQTRVLDTCTTTLCAPVTANKPRMRMVRPLVNRYPKLVPERACTHCL